MKKKKIFISINNNCNSSTGHIYSEIDQLKRMQLLIDKYSCSQIWFTTSKKEILGETQNIFESKNFHVLIGGIKRLVLIFVAIKYPSISIDASLSTDNCIVGTDHSPKIVYHTKAKQQAQLISKSPKFYPNVDTLNYYNDEKYHLMQGLNILKKYMVVQIKTEKVNGTLELLNPDTLLNSIKYFQDKNYQIVFAGREACPKIFLDNKVIDYANSKYASPLNDFLLIGHCSLVIASASGFCMIPEKFDKPLLTINSIHGIQYFGRRTILLPTLLTRSTEIFNAKIQHKYLCTYGVDCGYDIFDDLHILHMPNSQEILMAAKELESMLSDQVPHLTLLQKTIRDNDGCPLFSDGLSRISDHYLSKHINFFE